MKGLEPRPAALAFLLLAGLLTACGGTFSRQDGSGGNAGAAGSGGSTGGGGSPAAKSCEYDGQVFQDGDSFPSDDGCNGCSCDAGQVACTERDCVDPCEELQQSYSDALDQAKTCDAGQPGQCTELVIEGLICGCQAFVNPAHAEAIALAQAAQAEYSAAQCGGDVACGPCAVALTGVCSPEGRCETVQDNGGIACQVDGVIYPHGTGGIPDPVSCNTCQCSDGQLGCTEIGCPEPCPAGTSYGVQCVQCGPADGCEVLEHACLPVCSDGACEVGGCIDGICRLLCG